MNFCSDEKRRKREQSGKKLQWVELSRERKGEKEIAIVDEFLRDMTRKLGEGRLVEFDIISCFQVFFVNLLSNRLLKGRSII